MKDPTFAGAVYDEAQHIRRKAYQDARDNTHDDVRRAEKRCEALTAEISTLHAIIRKQRQEIARLRRDD